MVAPLCLLLGFLFDLFCHVWSADGPSSSAIGTVYIFEGLGAALGGLAFAGIFIRIFNPAETMCALVDGLDLDGITLMPLGRREKVGEKLVRDPMGVVYHLSDHGSPYPIEGPIKEAGDLKKFKLGPWYSRGSYT